MGGRYAVYDVEYETSGEGKRYVHTPSSCLSQRYHDMPTTLACEHLN